MIYWLFKMSAKLDPEPKVKPWFILRQPVFVWTLKCEMWQNLQIMLIKSPAVLASSNKPAFLDSYFLYSYWIHSTTILYMYAMYSESPLAPTFLSSQVDTCQLLLLPTHPFLVFIFFFCFVIIVAVWHLYIKKT